MGCLFTGRMNAKVFNSRPVNVNADGSVILDSRAFSNFNAIKKDGDDHGQICRGCVGTGGTL